MCLMKRGKSFEKPIDKEEQTKIIEQLKCVENTISYWELNLRKLGKIKNELMQDLLSGKVSVAPLLEQGD